MKIKIKVGRISPQVVWLTAKYEGKTFKWKRHGRTWYALRKKRNTEGIDLREVTEKEDCQTLDELVAEREKSDRRA